MLAILAVLSGIGWYIDSSGGTREKLACEKENSSLKDQIRTQENKINEQAAVHIADKKADAKRIDHLAEQVAEFEQRAPANCPVVGVPADCIGLLNAAIEGDGSVPTACAVPKIPAGTTTHLSLARFIDTTIKNIRACRANIKQIEAINAAADHAGF